MRWATTEDLLKMGAVLKLNPDRVMVEEKFSNQPHASALVNGDVWIYLSGLRMWYKP